MNNNNQYNLWRTEHPKFPQYYGNGTGRDSFIGFYNGGFIRNNCNKNPVTGTQITGQNPINTRTSPTA